MVLEFSNSIEHSPCRGQKRKLSSKELKQVMLRLMQEKGINKAQIDEQTDTLIAFKGQPDMKMHAVMLEAEKLGLSIKYSKKTLIEVC